MGRRRKGSQPPIKLVIGRSPEHKKGQENASYAVITQSATNDSANQSKYRAGNAEPKKSKEQESDDDDLEIIQVYKPPASQRLRHKAAGQNQTSNRPPLVMVCIDEELSVAQKQALRQAQAEYDNARQKINSLKRTTNWKEVILDSYVSPESLNGADFDQLGGVRSSSHRSSSPDVMIIDQPPVMKNKTTVAAVPLQPPTSLTMPSLSQPVLAASKPLPLLIRSNTAAQATASCGSQNALLMGTSGIPLVIPTHFVHKGGQPILLQANQAGCLQVLGSGAQNMPVLSRTVVSSGSKMVPPLAPKMSVGMPNPNLPPPPPLQCMAKNGQKRPTDIKENLSQPPMKRSRGRRKLDVLPLALEPEGASKAGVNWVPLDEYYYSKKEGDPAYREEKGEYRFKCFYCYKMLYNNLRTMMHIQGHIDSDKQQNLDLSDLTQCKYCYKQFDTPFEMQCHVEKIHQNRSNVLVCRICEKDHTSQADLKNHMHMHNACEMPYICQLCSFRSSVYDDVVDHFKKRHDSSRYLMCLYCLKIFEVRFAKASGWGMTQAYYQHLLKHQMKALKLKCSCCKLIFVGRQELQLHKNKDHLPNYRGTQSASSSRTVNASSEQVMICVPNTNKSKVKSLNAPASQKQLLVGFCNFRGLKPDHLCIECKKPMMTPEHYKKYTECSMCRFATICNEAFALHMYNFHVRGSEKKLTSYKENSLAKPLFCFCGYSSNKGNDIANHLVLCSKRTCYDEKPEVKWFEYDDEQEEFNPFEPYCEDESVDADASSVEKDVPTLFGALGLVKKPSSRSCSSYNSSKESSPLREPSPKEVAHEVIEDILDHIFPAEAVSKQFVSSLVVNVMEEIDKLEKRRYRTVTGCIRKRKGVKESQYGKDKYRCFASKSSEFQVCASEQAASEDLSSCIGSDVKCEDGSIDSELPTSRAAIVVSENKTIAGEESSNMDWASVDVKSEKCDMDSGPVAGSVKEQDIQCGADNKTNPSDNHMTDMMSTDGESKHSNDQLVVEETNGEERDVSRHEISRTEHATDSTGLLSGQLTKNLQVENNLQNVSEQVEIKPSEEELAESLTAERRTAQGQKEVLSEHDSVSSQDQNARSQEDQWQSVDQRAESGECQPSSTWNLKRESSEYTQLSLESQTCQLSESDSSSGVCQRAALEGSKQMPSPLHTGESLVDSAMSEDKECDSEEDGSTEKGAVDAEQFESSSNKLQLLESQKHELADQQRSVESHISANFLKCEPSGDESGNQLLAEVSAEMSAETSNEVSTKVSAETSNEVTAEVSAEMSAETSNEVSAETSNEVSAETSNEVSAETSNEVSAYAPEMSRELSDKVSTDVQEGSLGTTCQTAVSPPAGEREDKDRAVNRHEQDSAERTANTMTDTTVSLENTSAKKSPSPETKLQKDNKASKDHHSHNRSRHDDSDDSHHHHHSYHRDRDRSHRDHHRDHERSGGDGHSRHRSHSRDRHRDRDWFGQRPGRYQDCPDSKDYHGSREWHRHHGDQRDQRRSRRDSGSNYHGNRGYY